MTSKKFSTCPRCGYSRASEAAGASLPGGAKFGACVVGLAAMVTGIRARDISGKPRGPKFSQARTAVIIAMQRIAEATWAECGDAIARDRGSSHRMYHTWRDDPAVLRHAAAIVEKYEATQ